MYSQKEDHRQDYMAELYREEQKTKGLLENSPYQHSSQCHPALATKSIKKRLQPG